MRDFESRIGKAFGGAWFVVAVAVTLALPASAQKKTPAAPKPAVKKGAAPALPAESGKADAKPPLAIVDGKPVYEEDLMPVMKGQWEQLLNQEYQIKSNALDVIVNSRLISAEAEKKGVAMEDFIATEIDGKAGEPTEDDAKSAYQESGEKNNHTYEELAPKIREALKQVKVQEARKSYIEELKKKSDISILLRPPKYSVAIDIGRVRGPANAPVTIVEFSDFECPFCLRAYQTMKTVLPKFEGKVKLSYRDFPLRSIHSQAQSAAEAGRCAAEQNKFWEFHDLVFGNPGKLGNPDLLQHAKTLNLDLDNFSTCLTSGKYRSAIENDLQEGIQLGIQGTPAFYINGTMISGAQPAEVFEKAISAELEAAKSDSR